MHNSKEEKAWSLVKRAQSFSHAFRGIGIFFRTTPNAVLQFFVAVLVVFFGFYFGISGYEWIAVVFCIGFVIVAEAFNTAIEIDINLTSPEYHPYARDTKDVAAAAVLISGFMASVVGLIIFLPYVL